MRSLILPALALLIVSGCAAESSTAPRPQASDQTVLAGSDPANGSTVAGPVDQLKLRFSVPSRLLEVTVEGPEGLMPMMITAAAETTFYSIPLPGLGAGAYRVNWKASVSGRINTGTIAFQVRG
jgi:methionine-rich copper-binding protein CopC